MYPIVGDAVPIRFVTLYAIKYRTRHAVSLHNDPVRAGADTQVRPYELTFYFSIVCDIRLPPYTE